MRERKNAVAVGAVLALTAVIGVAAVSSADKRDVTSKSSEATVTTNENGSISRTFAEYTVTTNGSLVTEHRRETRTSTDASGNVLETSTSEYAQSYSVGDVPASLGARPIAAAEKGAAQAKSDSFLGIRFGAEVKATNFVADASEPTLLRTTFAPKKALAGFDDYYVYVTPKTHRAVKVYACAENAVEPGTRWNRHYLIEALEKRYGAWARLCSFTRPCYSFDIGGGRYATVCLAGASRDYETVLAAWDDALLTAAADETQQLREEAARSAAERRAGRVSAAAEAF